jgi:hypothetical protein
MQGERRASRQSRKSDNNTDTKIEEEQVIRAGGYDDLKLMAFGRLLVLESVEKKREVGDAKIRFGKSFLPASCHVDGKVSAYYANKIKKIWELEFGKIRMIQIWTFCGCHRVAVNRC